MKERVRADTETTVKNALEKDEPVLIEAPPASGKTYNAVRVAQKEGLKVTYLAARRDLYAQAEEEAKKADDALEYTTIPAPQRNCPTFSGERGDTGQAQRLYNKGRSGRQIHYSDTVHTPCQTPDNDCPYIEKLERVESETDTFDLLIGNHQHAYKEDYLEDRVVIFDEFNPSPFVEWFPSESEINDSPGEIIAEFLEAVEEIPYDDLTDVIEARELSKASEGTDLEWEWFRKNGAERKTTKDQIELTPSKYDAAHSDAALLTIGLMFANKVGRGIELAHEPDQWQKANINRGIRYVRDRNTNKMAILRPPSGLEAASQIIGMDALPTKKLWDTVFGCTFTLEEVIERGQLSEYLEEGLGFELIQLANGNNHYSSGNISSKDAYRLKTAQISEGSSFPVISRKKALERYGRQSWYKSCVKLDTNSSDDDKEKNEDDEGDEDDDKFFDKNYAKVKSSNDFAEEPLGFVSGSPFPSDDIIKYWCGLCGEETEPVRQNGTLDEFTGFGEDVYKHFTHHEVFQAILRFGRELPDDTKVTVYINTEAIPDWLSDIVIKRDLITPESHPKRIAVLDQLVQSAREGSLSEETVASLSHSFEEEAPSVSEHAPADLSISEEHIRNVLTSEELDPYINVRPNAGKGGSDLYKWAGDDPLQRCVCSDRDGKSALSLS